MKQKQNEAYAKMENGKYAYHTVHSKGRAKGGRERAPKQKELKWTELRWTGPNLKWSGVKVAADRESSGRAGLGLYGCPWAVAWPELPLSAARLSIFISTKCFWLWQGERRKKNVNLQLPPDKKGVDLHISVLLLLLWLYWSSEVAPVNCGSPSRKWRGLTKWRPRFVWLCVCVW